jgi:hypothetical protein
MASLLLGVDLMIRDAQPAVAAPAATPPQGDAPFALLLVLIFGLSVAAYGLYHERHKLREHFRVRMIYARHRMSLRLRFARRGLTYASLRRAMQRA